MRGYATGLFSGDRGYTLSLELRHAPNLGNWTPGGAALAATGFAFVDYGRVYPFRPPACCRRGSSSRASASVYAHLWHATCSAR